MTHSNQDEDEDDEMIAMKEKYHLTEVILGTGNFATVKLAFNATTGEKYAVKIINKLKFIQRPKFHENLVTEITILKKLNHVRISYPSLLFLFPLY